MGLVKFEYNDEKYMMIKYIDQYTWELIVMYMDYIIKNTSEDAFCTYLKDTCNDIICKDEMGKINKTDEMDEIDEMDENENKVNEMDEKDNNENKVNKKDSDYETSSYKVNQINKVTKDNEKKDISHNDKLLIELNTSINELKDKTEKYIKPLIEFHHGGVEKGKNAELVVKTLFEDNFKMSKIIDLSDKGKAGDLIVYIDSIGILVEVKNKSVVSTEDINKFYLDIETNQEEFNLNCGIFISHKTHKFPNVSHDKIYIETKKIGNKAIPVMFLYLDSHQSFLFGVKSLVNLARNVKDVNKDIYLNCNVIKKSYSVHKSNYDFIEEQIKGKNKEIKVLTKQLEEIKKILKDMNFIINKNADIEDVCDFIYGNLVCGYSVDKKKVKDNFGVDVYEDGIEMLVDRFIKKVEFDDFNKVEFKKDKKKYLLNVNKKKEINEVLEKLFENKDFLNGFVDEF